MFLNSDGIIVYSASDLSAAAVCEWAVLRRLDARLGRVELVEEPPDDMLERTARLGDTHELRYLHKLRAHAPVVEIARPANSADPSAAIAETSRALESAAPVIFQAAFFDGRFLGYADFLLAGPDGRYEVYDTKLARRAKITALLQLAAYSEQLSALGYTTGPLVHLILGDESTSSHRLIDILPVYQKRRARLEHVVDERQRDDRLLEWGDARYFACGRCDLCEQQVQVHRDLLLVNGLRSGQRAKLQEASICTIDQLALATKSIPGISDLTLRTLREQADLQLQTEAANSLTPAPPEWRVWNPAALAALPEPDEGDIFFDFEGDPLHQEGQIWGLDYLFGMVDRQERFFAFWAHDLAEEKRALIDFLAWLADRRARYPAMHIYHYASYERTHLLSIAARHGVGENTIDELLRHSVLVDLYPIVRQSLRVGSRSYSLKKLEPLYMGERSRAGVVNAADSISEYVRSRELFTNGDFEAAARVLAEIADYNAYDCVSTLTLCNWLLDRAIENDVSPSGAADAELDIVVADADPVFLELASLVATFPGVGRSADQTALALTSAAIDYHRREGKSFWWAHFSRLVSPLEDFADTRDVFIIESAEVIRDWAIVSPARTQSRVIHLSGRAGPGSSFSTAASPFVIYDAPFPPIEPSTEPGARSCHNRTSISVDADGSLLLTERLTKDATAYDHLPVALTPATPPPPGSQVSAISEWGQKVLTALPDSLADAPFDLLRRAPIRRPARPILQTESHAAKQSDSLPATALLIRDTLLGIASSYLAVQGPPGTGKTWNGARVIADLVQNHGWRIGVVAQSHATVENMLGAIVGAGLDPGRIGKKPRSGDESVAVAWTSITDKDLAAFTSRDGFVIGGTAWLFSNANRVQRQSLDLLVIDEAGQFSLASTIASAVAAKRLLLLGDPQQLPQVSQGTHPEPVDVSALGWLSAGHDVLPPQFGLFLDTSYRMHPALCSAVSELSYEGKLHAHPSNRCLESVEPGLHSHPVTHYHNSTSSLEEAIVVRDVIGNLLGRTWHESGKSRLIEQSDIIVVAPYNAQVQRVAEVLGAAGYDQVAIGTVDKFQGREAAIAIVTLAASSAEDIPRGLEFLLLANRLNVAISRAQWAAFVVYSPRITESLPTSVAALAQLSAFIRLVESNETPKPS